MEIDNKLLYKMISKRKSFHLFRDIGNQKITNDEINEIYKIYNVLNPLFPKIKTCIKIVPENQTTCKRGGEYCILFYSENKEGYLNNIGYLGEQLDLYLVSKNIGTLWYGIGKVKEKNIDNMEFVIMITIAKIDDESKFRKDMYKSKRKEVENIWSGEKISGITDIIRFSPSACNTQPWFVKHEGDFLKVYRIRNRGKRGIMPIKLVCFYNRIDIGIFLLFIDLCLINIGISFSREIFNDVNDEQEENIVAIYKLNR